MYHKIYCDSCGKEIGYYGDGWDDGWDCGGFTEDAEEVNGGNYCRNCYEVMKEDGDFDDEDEDEVVSTTCVASSDVR